MYYFKILFVSQCLFVSCNLQYGQQIVAALKLTVDGSANLTLGFFLLVIILLPRDQWAQNLT